MTAITFDSYKVVTDKGFTKDQSEAVVQVLREVRLDPEVTRQEMDAVDGGIAQIQQSLAKLDGKFDAVENRIKYDILKWMIPLFMGLYGLIVFKLGL